MDDDFNKIKNDNKTLDEDNFVLDLKDAIREMKRDLNEQMRGLREDIEGIKDDIRLDRGIRKHRPSKRPRKRKSDFTFHMDEDWGERFGASIENYVGGLIDSVGDAIDRSVGSIFQPSSYRRSRHKPRHRREKEFVSEEDLEDFYDKGSAIMAALSDSNRLRMLKELEKQPLRQSDLSEKTNTKGGNFKHHITILKDEGLVRQEGVRERYMLTFAGREALKLVEFLYARGKKRLQVPVIIDDAEEEE